MLAVVDQEEAEEKEGEQEAEEEAEKKMRRQRNASGSFGWERNYFMMIAQPEA